MLLLVNLSQKEDFKMRTVKWFCETSKNGLIGHTNTKVAVAQTKQAVAIVTTMQFVDTIDYTDGSFMNLYSRKTEYGTRYYGVMYDENCNLIIK